MIANKHTELRIYDNLNNLLQSALDEKEYKKKIENSIFKYIREYIDDNQYDKGILDIFDDLSSNYQKHCYNISKRVENNIFEEKSETNYLNPNVYTEEFRETLREELTDKIIERYFRELTIQENVYNHKNKINALRKREQKNIIDNNKDEIKFLINARINKAFEFYLNKANGDAKLVIDNFDYTQDIIDDIFDDVIESVRDSIDENITKSDIESMFNKQLKIFIRQTKAATTPISYPPQDDIQQPQKVEIQVPKSLMAYGIAKIWEDITK